MSILLTVFGHWRCWLHGHKWVALSYSPAGSLAARCRNCGRYTTVKT